MKYIKIVFSIFLFFGPFLFLFCIKDVLTEELFLFKTVEELNDQELNELVYSNITTYQLPFYLIVICISILYATNLFFSAIYLKDSYAPIKFLAVIFISLFFLLELPIYEANCLKKDSFWLINNGHFH